MAHGAFAANKAAALDFQPMMYMGEYLEQLTAEDRNPDYIRTVRNGLHHFAEFLRSENIISPEEITRLHLVRFQARCNERVTSGQWTKSYSIQVLKKARAWINWLCEVPYISTNPWQAIKVGAVKKQPKPLADDDLRELFQAHSREAFQMDPFLFHRREVILTLLYAWGLRINELAALTVTAMDQRNDFVAAKNKSSDGARKTQPYTPEIKRVVARWLAVRSKYATPGVDALLITTSGTELSIPKIRATVTDLGSGVGIKVNPHRLRDTIGTNMLDDDVPVERVQLLFGHSDKEMTLAYARVNDRKVFESVEEHTDPRLRSLFANTRDLRAE